MEPTVARAGLTSEWTPVDLRRIRVVFGDADQLYFHLRPLGGEDWDREDWEKAFAARVASDREAGRRLTVAADQAEYVLTWSGAPQDIGTAIEQVDELVDEVNAAYLRRREEADAGR